MATILIETKLDVIEKQRKLVEEALGPDSIYIRMKETLLDLLNAGDIKGAEKAKAIAETITQMSASILNLRSIVGAVAKHVILKTSSGKLAILKFKIHWTTVLKIKEKE